MSNVCIIVKNANGQCLGVSRRHDHNDYGFPAGKIEKGETPAQAAMRELKEETGFTATELKLIDERIYRDEPTFCFIAEVQTKLNTRAKSDVDGVTDWVNPEVLCSGSFGDYNSALLKKADSLK
jgi:8-oxo-dGTP pyrophosphatase MutT (NUDIX family)